MATKTWAATGADSASNGDAWSPAGALQDGDAVVLDTTSVQNMTYDVDVTLASFLANGYTGVISFTHALKTTGAAKVSSTGSTANLGTGLVHEIGGNLTTTPGTVNKDTATIKFTATTTVTWTAGFGQAFYEVDYGAAIVNISNMVAVGRITGNGCIINSASQPHQLYDVVSAFETLELLGSGTINVTHATNGQFSIVTYVTKKYKMASGWTINATTGLMFDIRRSVEVTLDSDFIVNGPIYNVMGQSNWSPTIHYGSRHLVCTDFKVNAPTSGMYTIDAGASIIDVSGNFDTVQTYMTFSKATSTVRMSGTSKTIKLNAADGLYNFVVLATATVTLASDVQVDNEYYELGTLALDAYALKLGSAGSKVVPAFSDKAVSIVGGGVYIFNGTELTAPNITLTSGAAVLRDPSRCTASHLGNLNRSALAISPNARESITVASGTTTANDDKLRAKEITIDSGATLVQASGKRMAIINGLTNNGTFTKNSPKLIARGIEYAALNIPKNLPLNQQKIRGYA